MSDRRRAWTWRHAILESDLKSTTRHVLLTIGCHMNDVGEGCYPTTKQLHLETGLSERAVCEHINLAIDAGWLIRFQHGYRGQKWKRNEYRPRWPDDPEGTDAGSAPQPKKALTDDQHLKKGTDGGSAKALTQGQCEALTEGQWDNNSQSTSQTLSLTAGERVCEIFDLDLNDWQMRVAEHFVAPLERCVNVRPKHRKAMPDLVEDLANYSSATLKIAAGTIRRERSVFPSIAQAVAACAAANKSTCRPMRLPKGSTGAAAWRKHLEAASNKVALSLFDSQPETTVDAELLNDALEVYGSEDRS